MSGQDYDGAGLVWYFNREKQRMQQQRRLQENKAIGQPRVGGPFQLFDTNGNVFTEEDLKGKYSLVYFGFTHCPDICPEELDKMSVMLEKVYAKYPPTRAALDRRTQKQLRSSSSSSSSVSSSLAAEDAADDKLPGIVPIFVTCDPARDDGPTLAAYLREFHPTLIGLTGSYEQVRNTCRQFRVYFSTPQDVRPGEDYLVDHSIYFYLMDPDGDFVETLGRQHSPDEGARLILGHMDAWRGGWGKGREGAKNKQKKEEEEEAKETEAVVRNLELGQKQSAGAGKAAMDTAASKPPLVGRVKRTVAS